MEYLTWFSIAFDWITQYRCRRLPLCENKNGVIVGCQLLLKGVHRKCQQFLLKIDFDKYPDNGRYEYDQRFLYLLKAQ